MRFGRYIAVGLWNTLFGYATFALFTSLLRDIIPYSYMAATVLASLINISVAFLGYKWFVFRTRGNYLREWARCVMVYSSTLVLSLILLPFLVAAARHATGDAVLAPYVGGALMTGVTVVVSFVGHRRISFRLPGTP